MSETKPEQRLLMKTEIRVEFIPAPDVELSPAELASLEALNFHCEDIAEKLQAPMRNIAVEMLAIKREIYGEPLAEKGLKDA